VKHTSYKLRDVEAELRRAGFEMVRTKKHRRWEHPSGHKINTVRESNGEMSDGMIARIYRTIRLARTGIPPEHRGR
jgi:predicted RNA binding protein YcfA (HicA-like mRNA interferase family)